MSFGGYKLQHMFVFLCVSVCVCEFVRACTNVFKTPKSCANVRKMVRGTALYPQISQFHCCQMLCVTSPKSNYSTNYMNQLIHLILR